MDALIEENEQLRKRMDWQKSAKADADLAPSASGGAVEDGLLALTASMSTGSVSTYKEAIAKNKEEIRAKMRDIEELQLMLANVSDRLIDWWTDALLTCRVLSYWESCDETLRNLKINPQIFIQIHSNPFKFTLIHSNSLQSIQIHSNPFIE